MSRPFVAIVALSLILKPCIASETDWLLYLNTWGINGNHVRVGAHPGAVDGYDGQASSNPVDTGPVLLLHRDKGPGWTGDTGFYSTDFESPIPSVASKTWWDLCLWTTSSSYLTIENRASFSAITDGALPPETYWCELVLDYVPDGLNWSGPWSFTWQLNDGLSATLPVPTVSDGLLGTRMHLTVYTTPIPEPSSLLALGSGVLGLWGLRRRRK